MKKLWRQKKFLWLLLIVILMTGGVFLQNKLQQDELSEIAYEKVNPYIEEIGALSNDLRAIQKETELNELQENQLNALIEMGRTTFEWGNTIYEEEWENIPENEGEFLIHLQNYIENGGQFPALQGIELEKAIEKNAWLQKNNLPFEDEENPLSPHLVLVDSSSLLFGLLGIFILVLFFGNSITTEKEQNTWLTLQTQPIPKWKLILVRYSSLIIVFLIFAVLSLSLGAIIPIIFGDYALNLNYPLVLSTSEDFIVIPVLHYLIRNLVLFACASFIIFGLTLLISKWMKNTFSSLLVSGFIIVIGYFMTEQFTGLQAVWNPFHFLQFTDLLSRLPQTTDWLYPLAAVIWSTIFLLLAIFLPEKKIGFLQFSEVKQPYQGGKTFVKRSSTKSIAIFDGRKTKRKGLLKQALTFLFLLILFAFILISGQVEDKKTAYLESLKFWTTFDRLSSEETLNDYEESLEEGTITQENYDWIVNLIIEAMEFEEERKEKIQAALDGYEHGDWLPLYEYQLFENRFHNGEFETGNLSSDLAKSNMGQFTINVSIAEKEWLIERDIQPIFPGEFVPTIYQHWAEESSEDEKRWQEYHTKIDNSGLFLLYFLFDNYFYLLPIVLFFFLLGAGFSSERGKNPTLNFLSTQPFPKGNIYLGKVINSSLLALISSIAISLFTILIGTIFNRFGDWEYPILHYDSQKVLSEADYTGITYMPLNIGGHFITLGEYLMNSVVLFLFVLLFVIVLSNFISIFIRNQLGVYMMVILITIGGYAASSEFLTDRSHLSPFTYFNIAKITNGEVSAGVNNPSIHALTGSLVLFVSCIMLVVVGYLFLRWRKRVS